MLLLLVVIFVYKFFIFGVFLIVNVFFKILFVIFFILVLVIVCVVMDLIFG